METVSLTWPSLISVLVSFVLPVLVGIVTKQQTHPGVKAALLLLLSTLSAFLIQIPYDTHGYDWKVAILTAVFAFVTGVAAQRGLWKPIGVSALAARSFNP